MKKVGLKIIARFCVLIFSLTAFTFCWYTRRGSEGGQSVGRILTNLNEVGFSIGSCRVETYTGEALEEGSVGAGVFTETEGDYPDKFADGKMQWSSIPLQISEDEPQSVQDLQQKLIDGETGVRDLWYNPINEITTQSLIPGSRLYFCTVVTNIGNSAARVSMYLSGLVIDTSLKGNIEAGVIQPQGGYKYTAAELLASTTEYTVNGITGTANSGTSTTVELLPSLTLINDFAIEKDERRFFYWQISVAANADNSIATRSIYMEGMFFRVL